MKIGMIIGGGYHSSLYFVTKDVVADLRADGHEVDYIFLEAPDGGLKNTDKHYCIKGLSHSDLYGRSGIIFRLLKNLFGRHVYHFLFSRYFCNQIEPYLKEYDSVFIHGTTYIALNKLSTPHYAVLHSCKYVNFLGRRSGINKLFFQKVYQRIYSEKRLLCVSNSSKNDMLNLMKAKPKSIETLYNGFNFEILKQRSLQGSVEKVPDKFIMAAGRPDHTKRFDILIKSYAKTKKTHKLVIFGEGRGLGKLKELCSTLGVVEDVIFWGHCDHLLPYFSKASAFILSSDVEGLPTVVIESIALGTPVVATDVGGVQELLSGRLQDWIVPKGDIEQLAKAIDNLLANPPIVGASDLAFLDSKNISTRYIELSEQLNEQI